MHQNQEIKVGLIEDCSFYSNIIHLMKYLFEQTYCILVFTVSGFVGSKKNNKTDTVLRTIVSCGNCERVTYKNLTQGLHIFVYSYLIINSDALKCTHSENLIRFS